MANIKKRGEVKMVSLNLSASTNSLLDEFSKESGMTKTRIVENAVAIYVEKMREAMSTAFVDLDLSKEKRYIENEEG